MISTKNKLAMPMILLFQLLLLINFLTQSNGQLSPTFYDQTCPIAETLIRSVIRQAVLDEGRMAASLIRLHFHDCFVQGCDGSVLLDEAQGIESEKSSIPNANSVRGYNVIENAKSEVEKVCPGVVSCADILAQAARDASVAVGGPSWTIKYGRRDSTTASRTLANKDLPSPFTNLEALKTNFLNKGLNEREMVVLSGAHTLGQARCGSFRSRIYNETNINPGFAKSHEKECPTSGGNSNLSPLDATPNFFDNKYYKNLEQNKGLLSSDQALYNGGSSDSIVETYSKSPLTFFSDFAAAMIKMGDIGVLTGEDGIVRTICSAIN